MSRVLFVTPPYYSWGVQSIGTWPPVQLAYLANAAEQAGHEARIYDAMNSRDTFADIRDKIAEYSPDAVVVLDYLPVTGAIATATVPAGVHALSIAKKVDPSIKTIIGGPHPTFMYEELLTQNPDAIDYVLRGESERTLPELLDTIESGDPATVRGIAFREDGSVKATPVRPHIQDLNGLTPAWHLLDWDLYKYNIAPWGRMAAMMGSRGCMMGCSFCSHRQFWRGDWRARDAQHVVDEMRLLVDEYKVDFITLIDPYPTHDRDRWENILDLLIEADMGVGVLMETRVEDIVRDADILDKYRRAGVIHVYLGAEGSTDAMLESMNKGTSVDLNKQALDLCREHDITTEASFMIGAPGETWDSIDTTIEVAIRLNPDIAVFPVLTPYPFTPVYEELKDRIRVFDYSKYNLSTPIIEPDGMSLDDVLVALGKCYMRFYSNKLKDVRKLPDGYKRRYMMSAFKAMMGGYKDHFAKLGGKMPQIPEGMTDLED